MNPERKSCGFENIQIRVDRALVTFSLPPPPPPTLAAAAVAVVVFVFVVVVLVCLGEGTPQG